MGRQTVVSIFPPIEEVKNDQTLDFEPNIIKRVSGKSGKKHQQVVPLNELID